MAELQRTVETTVLRAAGLWLLLLLVGSAHAEASNPETQRSDHWAFRPLRQVSVPQVEDSRWARTPVDHFILAKLEANGLCPSPPADKRTLLRRATFDLLGLPPTPEEVDMFLADPSPDAFARVVERLLASPHYGERWGRHWLDLVRYADTAGETADYPAPHAWRYRNWVIDALNRNQPYDEFLREQLAGDILAQTAPRERFNELAVATGFISVARRFGFDSVKDHHLTIEDTLDTLGKSVLGLTIACARCHEHKYDPISMADYYGLYGIFQSTRYPFPGCEKDKVPRDMRRLTQSPEAQAALARHKADLARHDDLIKAEENRQTELAARAAKALSPTAWLSVSGSVTNGGSQSFETGTNGGRLQGLAVKAGEMLQLTLQPKAGHGADSTVVELEIVELGGEQRWWSLTPEVLSDFYQDGCGSLRPDRFGHSNVWQFYEVQSAPRPFTVFVTNEHKTAGLHVWRGAAETPGVFINTNTEAISFLTVKLPPRSFGTHPGPSNGVAIAWQSPISGRVKVSGQVLDADASSGDGIAWTLEHRPGIASELSALIDPTRALNQLKRQRNDLAAREPLPEQAYATAEDTPGNARIHERGDPEKPGREVPRRFLELFGGPTVPSDAGSGRLQLAEWLTGASAPLTARVMVNRIWQHHFGQGLVKTSSDFGTRGQPPTHPELLEWLAGQFIDSGWDIKHMHRLLMNSAVYEQASGIDEPSDESRVNRQSLVVDPSGRGKERGRPRPRASDTSSEKHADETSALQFARRDPFGEARRVDPSNDLLWQFDRRRLSAEELRDGLLAVSGDLDRTPGGAHPFPDERTWKFTQHGPFSAVYETQRRSIYLMIQRIKRHPVLGLFDGADPNSSTGERQKTTVPTQALFFMNDPFVHACAASLAARLMKLPDDDARLDRAYRLAFGRTATAHEQEAARRFLDEYQTQLSDVAEEKGPQAAWAAYLRVLLSSNKFVFVD